MDQHIKNRRLETSCGTIPWRITDNNSVELLLIKQFINKETWGFAKGHINDGESIEECAVRETLEETGVGVTLSTRMPDCFVEQRDFSKKIISFLSKPVEGISNILNLDHDECEVADVRWFSIDALPKIQIYQQKVINFAIDTIKQTLNAHDSIEQALVFVNSYAGHVDDWATIKKELLKTLKPIERTSFSTRDPITKKQIPNDLERAIAEKWAKLSGRSVIFK